MSANRLLNVENVSKSFDGIRALDDLSFDVRPGELTALIGPNGAGKTTAFNMITGFTGTDSGRISFKGRPINGLPPHRITRLGIARTFQNIRLYSQMTVLENVMAGLPSPTAESLTTTLVNRKRVAAEESTNRRHAQGILESVSMANKREAMGNELSHGQRRLTELARTLALGPELILLDEPTAGLYPEMVRQMIGIIERLRAEGKTILFIEHDMDVVMEISDRIIVLNHGRHIAEGAPAEIQRNEEVIAAYLGRSSKRAVTS